MLSAPGVLLPFARHTQSRLVPHQRLSVSSLITRARKQAEDRNVEIDLAPDVVLPADLQKLSRLAKAELQQHLEARGLDKNGNKEELANRLLDNLITQESVLSTNPPDHVKLQQQLDDSGPVVRRAKRTSRKATTSAEPLPDSVPATDSTASAAGVEQPDGRRRHRTSRRVTSSADPIVSPADTAAATAASATNTVNSTETKPAGRARRTSRKATVSTDPLPSAAEMAAAAAAANGDVLAAMKSPRRGRRTSRTTSSSDPSDMQPSAYTSTTATEGTDVSSASQTAAPVRKRGRRTSTKTTSTSPVTAHDSTPASKATEAEVPAPAVSRAKQLAQQLAQKEIAAHGMAAAPGSTWVASDDLLSAGSQAQSDNLLMSADRGMQGAGAQSTVSVDNGSVDEVMAQLAAERASGLSDQPALRPEAMLAADSTDSTASAGRPQHVHEGSALADIVAAADAAPALFMQSLVEAPVALEAGADISDGALTAFDHMTLPPSAGAADAAASWSSAAVTSLDDVQHPNMADCLASVEDPLTAAAAERVGQDEDPDAVMAAFDHTTLDSAAAAAVANGNQVPSLQDIAMALPASSLPAALDETVGEDEVADETLVAFDHVLPDTPCTEAAATGNAVRLVDTLEDEPAGYDQPYLDPLQPSALGASVGSGSVDLADPEVDGLAQHPEQKKQGRQEAADLGAMVQDWWTSVVRMFEDWQKNLSGPK